MPLLLQVDRGLSVETLVFSLHVGEAREVIRVDERQIDLINRDMSIKNAIAPENSDRRKR